MNSTITLLTRLNRWMRPMHAINHKLFKSAKMRKLIHDLRLVNKLVKRTRRWQLKREGKWFTKNTKKKMWNSKEGVKTHIHNAHTHITVAHSYMDFKQNLVSDFSCVCSFLFFCIIICFAYAVWYIYGYEFAVRQTYTLTLTCIHGFGWKKCFQIQIYALLINLTENNEFLDEKQRKKKSPTFIKINGIFFMMIVWFLFKFISIWYGIFILYVHAHHTNVVYSLSLSPFLSLVVYRPNQSYCETDIDSSLLFWTYKHTHIHACILSLSLSLSHIHTDWKVSKWFLFALVFAFALFISLRLPIFGYACVCVCVFM